MNEHNSDNPVGDNGKAPSSSDGALPSTNQHPELDALLREWHQQNAARAAAGRERLTASLAAMTRASGEAKAGSSNVQAGQVEPMRIGETRPEPALKIPQEQHEAKAPRLASLLDGIETKRPQTTRQHEGGTRSVLGRIFMHRYSPLAAALLALASIMTYFVHDTIKRRDEVNKLDGDFALTAPVDNSQNRALIEKVCREQYVMAPDGGRLDAIDRFGNSLGPCILKRTDVEVNVSGFLNRVNIKQVYLNPHSDKVETVYTFPLSERAAVDRMTMTIGSRVIEGQVKERAEAKRIYEQAKAQGRVASLLEQERPNIFTQSIANIEPQAEVTIEISYVEALEQRDGVYSFNFPTTIAPRYIPHGMRTWELTDSSYRPRPRPMPALPGEFAPRHGIVLLGPADVVDLQPGDTTMYGILAPSDLGGELARAEAVRPFRASASVWYIFAVRYQDGSKETGTLYTNGAGVVNGRAFYSSELARRASDARTRGFEPAAPADALEVEIGHPGTGYNIPPGGAVPGIPAYPPAAPTRTTPSPAPSGGASPSVNQVPDANRITPMPVRPDTRAGHDISITVNIDSGGPAVTDIKSQLHNIQISGPAVLGRVADAENPTRKTIKLSNAGEIPNRDFSLSWKVAGGLDTSPIVMTHTGAQGNFFYVSMLPPARADDSIAVPREIMFVLDRSGSMKGYKIDQAKALIDATLATLRAQDTFNVLCFSDTSEKLWPAARRATRENVAEAKSFYGRNEGQGATEMLRVVSAALIPSTDTYRPQPQPELTILTPESLSNLPADGREVIVDVPAGRMKDTGEDRAISMGGGAPDIKVRISNRLFAVKAPSLRLVGQWLTENGDRLLKVSQVDAGGTEPNDAPVKFVKPIRLVAFITDGEVGNDMEVLGAIRQYRGDARVFSFAIGNSPNRYLLDGMARLGRGDVDYVPLNSDANEVIARFTRRVNTPVLTDIKVDFSPNIQPVDVLTALGGGGGSGERVGDGEFIPDLYDQKPVIIVGRYNAAASGSVTISGNTAGGAWSKTVNVDLPVNQPQNSAIASVWARTKIESIMDANLVSAQRGQMAGDPRNQIVALGESFNLVTAFTSFVAVDRLRVTVGGQPRLVQIPIDFPQGDEWSGYFGGPEMFRRRGGDEYSRFDANDDRTLGFRRDVLEAVAESRNTLGFGAAVDSDAVSFSLMGDIPLALLLEHPQGWPSVQIASGATDVDNLSELSSIVLRDRAADGYTLRDQASAAYALNFAPPSTPVPATAMPAPGKPGTGGSTGNAGRELAGRPNSPGLQRTVSPAPAEPDAASPPPPPPAEVKFDAKPAKRSPAAARATGDSTRGRHEEQEPGRSTARGGSAKSASAPAPAAQPAGPANERAGAPMDSGNKKAEKEKGAEDAASDLTKDSLREAERAPAADAASNPVPGEVRKLDAAETAESPVNAPVASLKMLIEQTQSATDPAARMGVPSKLEPQTRTLIDTYRREADRLAALLAEAARALAEQGEAAQADAETKTSHDKSATVKTEVSPPVKRAVRIEEVAMHIASLAERDRADEAKVWVSELSTVFPQHATAQAMETAIDDATLDQKARMLKLIEIGRSAGTDLAKLVREARIRRVMEDGLIELALRTDLPEKLGEKFAGEPAAALPDGATAIDSGLLVSVIVTKFDEATLKQLRDAGLRVESQDAGTKVIVGVAPLGKLDDLALAECVRRVEVTR